MIRLAAMLIILTIGFVVSVSLVAFGDLCSVEGILRGRAVELGSSTTLTDNPTIALSYLQVRNLSVGHLQVQGITESCFLKSPSEFPIDVAPLGTARIIVVVDLSATNGAVVPVELFVNGRNVGMLVDGIEIDNIVGTPKQYEETVSILEVTGN